MAQTIWFKLKGSTHDETSLPLDNLALTVDELKEKLLSSKILDIPKEAKKSTIFIYLKGKEESDSALTAKRRLNARTVLSELKLDANFKTLVVEVAEIKEKKKKSKEDHGKKRSRSYGDEVRYSKRIRMNKLNNECNHPCQDKYNCKHPCCKKGISDYNGVHRVPVTPKKKKVSTNGPCSHKCIDKSSCGHLCCKKGIDTNSPAPPTKTSKKTKQVSYPCKHNCKDKSTCKHKCCKQGHEQNPPASNITEKSTESDEDDIVSEDVKSDDDFFANVKEETNPTPKVNYKSTH